MNEQRPAAKTDEAQAQFDVEAAQKAKAFLEEGVLRSSWVDAEGNRDVVDSDDHMVAGVSQNHRSTIKREDDRLRLLNAAEAKLNQKTDMLDEISAKLKDITPAQREQLREMKLEPGDDGMDHHEIMHDQLEAKDRRDAYLWRGRQHYLENQPGYVADAVEEANAAGHDITLGGHHFPAQAPETQSKQVAPEKNHSEGQVHVGVARMSSGSIPTHEVSEEDAIRKTEELIESGQITESLPMDERPPRQ